MDGITYAYKGNKAEAKDERKYYLMDVAALRLLLIGVLVIYHSLCIFSGGWEKPYEGFPDNDLYYWMCFIPHTFRIEAMVLISGLIFGYTLKRKPERNTAKYCILQKAKRLLLPCIIFSAIYFWMFISDSFSLRELLFNSIDGCGHLWFLPMIFLCFVFTYLISTFLPRVSPNTVLAISALVSMLPQIQTPALRHFGLAETLNYFFFFYAGFCVKQGNISIRTHRPLAQALIFAVFVLSLIILGWCSDAFVIEGIGPRAANLLKAPLIKSSFRFITALTALYLIMQLLSKPQVGEKLKHYPWLITLSSYCYGVYLYQQFILEYLYYKTDIPLAVNPHWLPWIGSAICLALSLLFTHLTIKTQFGRFLMG